MPGIPSEFVEQLRAQCDIVEVVGSYLTHNQKSGRYWACCPFHGEKTPSFSVDPQRQMFYCFGCHEGGNVITFVMKQEHVPFQEAVHILADRVGLTVPEAQFGSEESAKLRARAMEAATCAARFFRQNLMSDAGKAAQAYLTKRQISPQAVRKFGLGYALPGWDSLYQHLKSEGYSVEEMRAAGLVTGRDGKNYDMFRERLMFPIFDTRGRVIAFGGRVLGQGEPKYLNSAETYIFNKRRNLYGLHLLRGAHKIPYLILVEGYIDVVSLVSHGVTGAVATLGTALTEEQARLMKRYCQKIVICYDGDSAGINAATRAITILKQAGLEVSILSIPDGQDPDDYVKAHGAEGFAALPQKTPTQFYLDCERAKHDLAIPQGRQDYAVAACKILSSVQPVEAEAHLRTLCVETGFAHDVLARQIGAAPSERIEMPEKGKPMPKAETVSEDVKAQRALLALYGAGYRGEEVGESAFCDETLLHIYKLLQKERDPQTVVDKLLADGQDALAQTASKLFAASLPEQSLWEKLARQYRAVIRRSELEREIESLKAQLPGLPPKQQIETLSRVQQAVAQLQTLKVTWQGESV